MSLMYLLYIQQGADIIWPSSWPIILRMLCGCFDDAALLSSLLQQQGGERRTQCPYPLFFHLAGTQMDTLVSVVRNVQKEEKLHTDSSPSWAWKPADVLEEPLRRKSPLPPGEQLDSSAAAPLTEATVCRDLREEVRVQWWALYYKPSLYHFIDWQCCLWGCAIQAWKEMAGYTPKIASCLS